MENPNVYGWDFFVEWFNDRYIPKVTVNFFLISQTPFTFSAVMVPLPVSSAKSMKLMVG